MEGSVADASKHDNRLRSTSLAGGDHGWKNPPASRAATCAPAMARWSFHRMRANLRASGGKAF